MALYVDGMRVGRERDDDHRPRPTAATGGSAATTSAAGRTSRRSYYFNGTIDEVAIYPTALTAPRCATTTSPAVARSPSRRRRPTPTAQAVYNDEPDALLAAGRGQRADRRRRQRANQTGGTYAGGVTYGAPRAGVGVAADTAVTLNGGNGASSARQHDVRQPDHLHRGAVVQDHHDQRRQADRLRQHARPALSGSYDRHVYMDNDGQLTFGVWTGITNTITDRRSAYNDGQWHHVVATQGADGHEAVRRRRSWSAPTARPAPGLHRLLAGRRRQPPGAATQQLLRRHASTRSRSTRRCCRRARSAQHYAASAAAAERSRRRRRSPRRCTELACSFDGSARPTPTARSRRYAWNFGDGDDRHRAPRRRTPTPRPGTYTVTLTVTDNEGDRAP